MKKTIVGELIQLIQMINPQKSENLHSYTELLKNGILDSLSLVKLSFLIEDKFNIQINLEEASSGIFSNIENLSNFIMDKKK